MVPCCWPRPYTECSVCIRTAAKNIYLKCIFWNYWIEVKEAKYGSELNQDKSAAPAVCVSWELLSLFALLGCHLGVITKGAHNLCATRSCCESTQSAFVGCTLIVFQWQPKKKSERSAQLTNVIVCGLSINADALTDKKAPHNWHPCWHTYRQTHSSI